MPTFIAAVEKTLSEQANKESNLKVNNASSTRSRKSVLDSQQSQQNLLNWSTKLDENLKLTNKIESYNLNKKAEDNTLLNLSNVTVEHLGQKCVLRCVVDGTLAQTHFRVRSLIIFILFLFFVNFILLFYK